MLTKPSQNACYIRDCATDFAFVVENLHENQRETRNSMKLEMVLNTIQDLARQSVCGDSVIQNMLWNK